MDDGIDSDKRLAETGACGDVALRPIRPSARLAAEDPCRVAGRSKLRDHLASECAGAARDEDIHRGIGIVPETWFWRNR
jgi:hypothetical protein